MNLIEQLNDLCTEYEGGALALSVVTDLRAIIEQHKSEATMQETIRTQQAKIERLKSQLDRLVNALDDASQAVWGYSDYRHDMGHIDIADKFNLMYGEHRALIAGIEAEDD